MRLYELLEEHEEGLAKKIVKRAVDQFFGFSNIKSADNTEDAMQEGRVALMEEKREPGYAPAQVRAYAIRCVHLRLHEWRRRILFPVTGLHTKAKVMIGREELDTCAEERPLEALRDDLVAEPDQDEAPSEETFLRRCKLLEEGTWRSPAQKEYVRHLLEGESEIRTKELVGVTDRTLRRWRAEWRGQDVEAVR